MGSEKVELQSMHASWFLCSKNSIICCTSPEYALRPDCACCIWTIESRLIVICAPFTSLPMVTSFGSQSPDGLRGAAPKWDGPATTIREGEMVFSL